MKKMIAFTVLSLAAAGVFAQAATPSAAASAGIPGTNPKAGAEMKAEQNVQNRADKKADKAQGAKKTGVSASDAAASSGK